MHELDQLANFGIITGGSLFLLAGFRLLYVVDGLDAFWRTGLVFSSILFLLGLFYPVSLLPIHKGMQKLTGWIGKYLLGFLLIVVYFGLLLPIGWLMRRRSGTAPVFSWSEQQLDAVEGWITKEVIIADQNHYGLRGLVNLLQPFNILAHFVRYRQYILLPVVIFLIAIGLLIFFASSSVLAPFIYTIF